MRISDWSSDVCSSDLQSRRGDIRMDEQNPYRGPDAEVAEFSSGDELAGRGARLGAAIIDALILMVILGPLTYMGGYWQAAMDAGQAGGPLPFGTPLTMAVLGFVVLPHVPAFPPTPACTHR